jgi:hypothetical protein
VEALEYSWMEAEREISFMSMLAEHSSLGGSAAR